MMKLYTATPTRITAKRFCSSSVPTATTSDRLLFEFPKASKPMTRQISTILMTVLLPTTFSSCWWQNQIEPRTLVQGSRDNTPSFSPDGNFIAYTHQSYEWPEPTDYPSGLYIVDREGNNRVLVLEGFHDAPDWSPDGEWLVFSSNGTIEKCKIDGSELTTFTGLDYLDEAAFYFPDWTRDGRYILFDKPFDPEWGFYFTDQNFAAHGRSFGVEILGRDPELSPDRSLLLYSTGKGGGGDGVKVSEVFQIDTLGLSRTQLTANNRDNRSPTWSPDGQQIAWTSNVRIWIMNADGSNQREIARGKDPSWSVNDEIVYSNANSDYSKEVLFIIQPDGKNKRQITF
jgi:Tol biopolymer transport system component